MTFKKGNIPWNLGKPHLVGDKNPSKRPEVRKKISDAKKGCKCWLTGLTKETDKRVQQLAENVSKTRNLLIQQGLLVPWNKGLTKKDDPRIAKQGKNPWNKGLYGEKYLQHFKNNQIWNKGLTKENNEKIKLMAEKEKETILKQFQNGRTAFMKGKTHTKKYKRDMSIKKSLFKNLNFKGNCNSGFREDLGIYLRSNWEANVCRILNFLKEPYEYEKYIFKLDDITRYKPDLYLPKQNIFLEIKGYLSEEANEKIQKFRKKYPNKKLIIIDRPVYSRLTEDYKDLIPNWEIS